MSNLPAGEILHFTTTAQRIAYNTGALSEGQLAYVQEADKHYRWDGTAWDEFGEGGVGGGVDSIAKDGETGLTGDVTLSEGANVTLTQTGQDIEIAATGAAGAPADVDYLVGTADGDLSNEIVVGTTPGGELGGTWGSPTVDASHSGSTHAATQAAAEATAASALTTHEGAADPHTGYLKESDFDDVDFLVGTATGHTGAEIVVGTTPGGELGGTWASPTVDATHAGSTHSAATDTHIADGTDAHDASAISIADAGNDFTATDVEGALDELQADNEAHVAAADPHTGYLRESVLSEANAVDLTDGGETALHSHAGSGSTIDVQEEGVLEVTASALNFDGDDFDIADAGGGVASIDVAATHAGSTHSAATDTHIADAADAHDASAISVDSTSLSGTGTDVQASLEEIDNLLDDHSARHEDGGADEISLTGLSGDSAAVTALRGVDFLVGTATGELTGEIVAGTAPGGELGGTWASPTVDATHSGSAHHTQSHDHSAAGDGTTLTPATLNVPNAAAPAPTAEGQMAWDNNDHFLTVGDGAATKNIYPTVDATSDPLAVSTAAADGTEATNARKDHVHAHEAAHINHDTTWAAKGDIIAGTANDTASVLTVGSNDTILMADSSTGTGLKWAAAATTTEIADIADSEAAGSSDTYARGDHVHSGAAYAKESDFDAVTFTIGAFFDGNGSTLPTGVRPIWRAPFACTVTQVRGYVDTGTTTVINAGKGATSASDFCSSNITIDPADAWETGTVNQNQSVASGDTVSVEIVTAGTATQVTIQIELTRDLSP